MNMYRPCSLLTISIHAPTRGATQKASLQQWNLPISIHAPTRGATLTDAFNEEKVMYFNPRSYKRSDADQTKQSDYGTFISIHAPTRGAT